MLPLSLLYELVSLLPDQPDVGRLGSGELPEPLIGESIEAVEAHHELSGQTYRAQHTWLQPHTLNLPASAGQSFSGHHDRGNAQSCDRIGEAT